MPHDDGIQRRQSILILGEPTEELGRLVRALEEEGYHALVSRWDSADVPSPPAQRPDLFIVDMDPTPERGLALVRHLKQKADTHHIPVIVLLPPGDPAPFNEAKADDIVLRPLRLPDLLPRVRLHLGRAQRLYASHYLRAGDLAIDIEGYKVFLGQRSLDLTYTEYKLLVFLATHPDRVFTRDTLLSEVWGYDHYGGTRTVDVHIRRLRSKIEDDAHRFIETMRNVGYRFRAGIPAQRA